LWLVIPIDDTIDKKLKKYKANKPLINNYLGFLEELKLVNDPATLGEIKCGQYKNC